MPRMRPYLAHGILELDNNVAERGMRAIALGRKNYLFVGSEAGGKAVGSEAGGKAAAIAYTLIENRQAQWRQSPSLAGRRGIARRLIAKAEPERGGDSRRPMRQFCGGS